MTNDKENQQTNKPNVKRSKGFPAAQKLGEVVNMCREFVKEDPDSQRHFEKVQKKKNVLKELNPNELGHKQVVNRASVFEPYPPS